MLNELIDQDCICIITSIKDRYNNDNPRIMRVADIIGDRIEPFECDPDEKFIFDNRTYFTLKQNDNNLPTKEAGFIGVWTCNAVENKYDSSKDFPTVKYCPDYRPIPIVECKVGSAEDLVKQVRKQIQFPMYYKSMIVAYNENRTWYGIHLYTSILTRKDGKYYIPENMNRLTLYQFTSDDIVYINDQKFLAYMQPNSLKYEFIAAKDITEIVKDQIVSQISWSALQQKGYTRDQYSKVKAVLDSLNFTDVISNVRKIVNCSEDEAKRAVTRYIDNVNQYLDGNSLEDIILKSLYSRDEQLRQRLTGIAQKEWEAEVAEKRQEVDRELADSYEKIDSITLEVSKKQKMFEELSKSLELKQKEMNELTAIHEKLENELANRLQTAREDIVSLVAQYPVFSAMMQNQNSYLSVIEKCGIKALAAGKVLEATDDLESEEDVIALITDSLRKNGLTIGARELSALMYSCYLLSVPICLAGPYGKLIADIFSGAVQTKSVTDLNCMVEVTENDFEAIKEERIIHVSNVFNSRQKDEIIEKLLEMRKFVIYSMPFKEDLQIEPAGILNYMIPVFTENLFEKMPEGTIYVGRKVGAWTETDARSSKEQTIAKVFRKIGCSSYQNYVLRKVISLAKSFIIDNNEDLEYLLIAQSFSFVLGKDKVLRKALKSAVLTSTTKELLEEYCGEEDDD